MSSSFGKNFKIMTFGESHGEAVGAVIDGVVPGIKISKEDIQKELDKRKPGQSKITTLRKEKDEVHILSGIFEGKTTGHPICLVVYNKNQDSSAYDNLKDIFRPGHADFTYLKKYGIRDYRGGGRSSGRETVGRVAAGAVAKRMLGGIKIIAYTKEVAGTIAKTVDLTEIEKNPVRCPDKEAAKEIEKKILKARKEGDSLGGIIEVIVKNCPSGLGEPVFDKLDADIAKAVMSIGAVKGIEFGAGFSIKNLKGSSDNDEFYLDKNSGKVRQKTNKSGGILGGISSGEDILFRVAVKPTASIAKDQFTVDTKGKRKKISIKGRHDPCLCPRIIPVVENMVAIVLADAIMQQERIKGNKK